MSKSIPLKEIVGFLPYGLKVMHTEFEREGAFTQEAEIVTISTECICFEAKWGASDYYFNEPDCEIKPIVRPLSDLTKEITHNGETIKPYEILFPVDEFDKLMDWTSLKCAEEFLSHEQILELCYPMEFWEKLKELKFDIYYWIKDGLAISINDL